MNMYSVHQFRVPGRQSPDPWVKVRVKAGTKRKASLVLCMEAESRQCSVKHEVTMRGLADD